MSYQNNDKPHLLSTSMNITEACTLNCKLCLAYVPYYSEYKTPSDDEFCSVLNKYFQAVESVDKFSLTGGEPLLHKDLPRIIERLFFYEKQVNQEIILITNGTIRFTDELLETFCKCSKMKVIVNDYGNGLSPHAEYNAKLLQERGIHFILYTEDNRYGWIDCRDHSRKHNTVEAVETQSHSCAFFLGKKWVISRGKLYTCNRAAFRITEHLIPSTEDDYIDLIGEETSVITDKMKRFLTSNYTCSCAYCDGLKEGSKKYIAAEQLERG